MTSGGSTAPWWAGGHRLMPRLSPYYSVTLVRRCDVMERMIGDLAIVRRLSEISLKD